ncbi:MAG: NADH-quinone oxidoreductase subunit NuoN [Mycobacteriales bacterium]|nr:NADH-quinone oxidoreductase subunit NuoN [Frankia sp.]
MTPLVQLLAQAEIPEPIQAPSIAYRALSPMLIVFAAALVGVLVEAFTPARRRRAIQLPLALVSLLGALVATVALAGEHRVVAAGAVAVDGPTLFLQGSILAVAVASVLLLSELQTEAYPLVLFAVGGMMLFPASTNLLTMFVALEVLSLPLYLLSGIARRRKLLGQEAALKYFLLGAFSSAFFLYGIALIYGYAGTVSLSGIADATAVVGKNDALLYAGLALLGVGLLFKLGAVPFHSWTPDVYQGAPTPITALMAAATKIAAFGALLRVLYAGFGAMRWDWRPAVWAVALLTMAVGSVVAVTQTDVKRMLAYSSIAHAGFILVGVAAATRSGLQGALFYLVAYGFTVLGAFAVVTLVRDHNGEATHLSQWAGLGRRSPAVAVTFAVFLFALAGIPGTSGFIAKFAVFQAAVAGRATPLVIVGVLTSAVAAFFYARVVVLMFFQPAVADGPDVVTPSLSVSTALGLALAATVVIGVLPGGLLHLAEQAALFVR